MIATRMRVGSPLDLGAGGNIPVHADRQPTRSFRRGCRFSPPGTRPVFGTRPWGRERHRGVDVYLHGGGCKEAAMLDTILHDRIRELEGKLRQNAPATKADIDELRERLAKIETILETLCRDAQSAIEPARMAIPPRRRSSFAAQCCGLMTLSCGMLAGGLGRGRPRVYELIPEPRSLRWSVMTRRRRRR